MALRLYFDAAATQEITTQSPDTVRKAVPAGQTMTDERAIYIKSDDPALTYENIVLDGVGDADGATQSGQVDVLYAPDNGGTPGTYVQTLTLANGAYTTPVRVWRKVVAPNVQAAFRVTTIQHSLSWDEYVA